MWVHALDNSDVTWFSPTWTCSSSVNTGVVGYDALIFSMHQDKKVNGAYCDNPYDIKRNFICEGFL